MSPTVDLAEWRPSLNVGAVGPVLFVEMTGPLSPEDLQTLPRFHEVMRRHPRAAIVTLMHRISLPDAATRAAAAEVMRHIPPGTTRAVALLDGGLFACAIRSVLTGLYLVSGGQHVHNIVTTVDAALDVVAAGLDVDRRVADAAYAAFVAHRAAAVQARSASIRA